MLALTRFKAGSWHGFGLEDALAVEFVPVIEVGVT